MAAPPWLVSLTLHLAAALLLALWVIPQPRGSSPHFVTLAPVERAASQPLASIPALQLEVAGPPRDVEPSPAHWTAASVEPIESIALDRTVTDGESPPSLVSDLDALFASAGGGLESALEGEGAEFFGVQARGSKFVFVVDSSNSMRRGKLDAAKEELLYAVRRLSSDQRFYVIFFNGNTVPMSLDESGEPEPEPLPATTENILRLEAWIDAVEVDPWTNPHEAMRQAIALLPDAIYLLSDGRFTDRGETVRFLKKENYVCDAKGRRPKVVIHTVGFHQRDGEPTLKRIARSYGGAYRFVPPPK